MHCKTFKGSGGTAHKLQAWCRGPQASATFGAANWVLTEELLGKLRKWERKWLRRALRLRRSPNEGTKAFNLRTADRLDGWLSDFKLKDIVGRILTMHFRAGLRTEIPIGCGERPLTWARNYRNEQWWEDVRGFSHYKRKKVGFVKNRQGPHAEWSNLFSTVYGESEPKPQRHSKQAERYFILKSHEIWGMRVRRSTVANDINDGRNNYSTTKDNDSNKHCWEFSSLEDDGCDKAKELRYGSSIWESTHLGKLCFVVDSQILAHIINGDAELKQYQYKANCRNILDCFTSYMQIGWLPSTAWGSYVKWRRRDENHWADRLCNIAMNIGPFQRTWAHNLKDFNILVRSDGGSREHTSASAWCIANWQHRRDEWHLSAVAVGSLLFPEAITPFAAESYALEDVSRVLLQLLRQ